MALKDHAPETSRRPSGLPCSVQALIDSLDDDDRAELHSWMYELGHSQEKIYEAVKAAGHVVAKQTINRHRSGGCRCFQ
jgi:hypothetical protein